MTMHKRMQSDPIMDKTLDEIVAMGIPGVAVLKYDGCGSHEAHFVWRQEMTPKEEKRERERIAANARAIRERERPDREAGF